MKIRLTLTGLFFLSASLASAQTVTVRPGDTIMVEKSMQKETIVTLVLDETGSMQSCKSQTISGFNEYVSSLKKLEGKVGFGLMRFNSEKLGYSFYSDTSQIQPLTDSSYQPNNLTNLFDAIGKGIVRMEESVKAHSSQEKPAVLFVILTDGQENNSKEFTRDNIFARIKEKEAEGWSFIYLGANQDAFGVASSLGVSKGNTMNFHTDNIYKTFGDTMVNATVGYSVSGGTKTKNLLNDQESK